jgi:hypothetical protein
VIGVEQLEHLIEALREGLEGEEGAIGSAMIVAEVLVPGEDGSNPESSVMVVSQENRFAKEGLLREGIRVVLGGYV